MKIFYNKISNILAKIVEDNYGVKLDYPLWELPSRHEFGDLSTMAALKLASKLKKDPLDIAADLKSSLDSSEFSRDIDKIEILKPGFLNIFVSKNLLIDSLNGILKKKESFFQGKARSKVLLEFLSANPTGPLSIAHGRQAVVGDVIANILEFFGNDVTREYYINDAGRQIELFHESTASALEALRTNTEFNPPESGYKGDYIKDIAKAYDVKGKMISMREFSIKMMIDLIKKDLKALGIKNFDNWFSQEKLILDGKVDKAIVDLESRNLIYEKDHAVWFNSTKFGDDKDRVIKKADGELTYFSSDIAYHKEKIERKYDILINLWGPDHHGYIKRVKKAFLALGYSEEILKILIIQLVTLKTKEKMSKRSGNIILLSELIKDIGKDATRFYYLTRKNSSHLEFDIDLAKKSSFDNPLYYIQYVCARVESIFRKVESYSFDGKCSKLLVDPEEINLIRILLQFSYYLEKAYYSLEPMFIVEFLKILASSFHKFYEKVRVIVDDKELTKARLNLLKSVQVVFHCALNLLGIDPVEKM